MAHSSARGHGSPMTESGPPVQHAPVSSPSIRSKANRRPAAKSSIGQASDLCCSGRFVLPALAMEEQMELGHSTGLSNWCEAVNPSDPGISAPILSSSPLSPLVMERNEAVLERLQLAEQRSPTKSRGGCVSTVGGANRPRMQVEAMAAGFQDIDAGIQSIRVKQTEFMRVQKISSGSSDKVEQLSKPAQACARVNAYDFRDVAYTRAQRRAMLMFDKIDRNQCERGVVFDTIPEAPRRAEVKLDYYRDRSDLVLPPIEDGFMIKDGDGQRMVDLRRLQVLGLERERQEETLKQTLQLGLPTEPCRGRAAFLRAETSRPPELWAEPLSPSSSLKSLQLKGKQGAELRQVHQQRVISARGRERNQVQARRLEILERQFLKEDRKENACRHRGLLVSLVCVLAMQAFKDIQVRWRFFVLKRRSRENGKLTLVVVEDRSGDSTHSNVSLARAGHLSRATVVNFESCLLQKLQRQEVEELRQRIVHKWFHVLRVVKFLCRVRRILVRHRSADLIKIMIEATCRGAQARRAVKQYREKVVYLQRNVRQTLQTRRSLLMFTYLPAVYNAETFILGAALGLPKETLQTQVSMHEKWLKQCRCFRDLKIGLDRDNNTRPGGSMAFRASLASMGSISSGRGSVISPTAKKAGTDRRTSSTLNVMQKYRLPEAQRWVVAKQLLNESTERYWALHLAHKAEKEEFRKRWFIWVKENRQAIANVASRAFDCALLPPFPRQLLPLDSELAKVDKTRTYILVMSSLKQTQVGVLLS